MEYKILEAKSLISEEQLNDIAQDGWLLVCIVPVEYTYYFYFRRALEETPDG